MIPGHRRHSQYPVGVPQTAVQRQLAQENRAGRRRINLPGAQEHPHRDWQVVGWSLFLQIGRRQVNSDALQGKFAAAVAQGGPDPLLGFLDRGIGQPHDVEGRQAWGNVDFDLYHEAVQSYDGAGMRIGKHVSRSLASRWFRGWVTGDPANIEQWKSSRYQQLSPRCVTVCRV